MVEFLHNTARFLSDKERVNFVKDKFTPCSEVDRPAKEFMVDMENGHLVKLVAFVVPNFTQFAVCHYVKDAKGNLEKIPPQIIASMHNAAAYTTCRSCPSSKFDDVVSYMEFVKGFPKTTHYRTPSSSPSFKPPIYPTMPWARTERINTANNVRLAGQG